MLSYLVRRKLNDALMSQVSIINFKLSPEEKEKTIKTYLKLKPELISQVQLEVNK